MFVGAFLRKGAANHQDFFRVERRKVLTGRDAHAGAGMDRHRRPGFADAVAVEVTELQIGKHLRGWNHDDAHVGIGINLRRFEPLAKQKVVRGVRKDDTKAEGLPAPIATDFLPQCSRIANAAFPKPAGESDGVTLQTQNHKTKPLTHAHWSDPRPKLAAKGSAAGA